jgi:hypothetical protein
MISENQAAFPAGETLINPVACGNFHSVRYRILLFLGCSRRFPTYPAPARTLPKYMISASPGKKPLSALTTVIAFVMENP